MTNTKRSQASDHYPKMTKHCSILIAILGLTASGCGASCTTKGCVPHVEMILENPQTEEGLYQILISTDVDVFEYNVSIPRADEDTCDEMLSVDRKELSSDSGDAEVGTSGQQIVAVVLTGEHSFLDFSIRKDGQPITEVEIEPSYVGEEINGEGCGECQQAQHTIDFDD